MPYLVREQAVPEFLPQWKLDACRDFVAALEAAGLLAAASEVDIGPTFWPPAPTARWLPTATQAQKDAFASLVAGWDWSEGGQAAVRKARAKAEAKDAFADTGDATRVAARNADRALYRSLRETRNKINELVAWANANGASISPLANRTFAQAMAAAAQLVDAEQSPTGD